MNKFFVHSSYYLLRTHRPAAVFRARSFEMPQTVGCLQARNIGGEKRPASRSGSSSPKTTFAACSKDKVLVGQEKLGEPSVPPVFRYEADGLFFHRIQGSDRGDSCKDIGFELVRGKACLFQEGKLP